ncbi:hypothetical protein BJ508DRAFT_413044 [Ascobolus immersus RN42]|uniref:Uncharacterized protein n=1 Tax=Ascobolus immersus RN42 TaxID=1160509 RepID=A0A3N4IE16_ASCIM|nr:hypothetical protein BJ508DRAFT_413044 [Ascobolus immersus RN42]
MLPCAFGMSAHRHQDNFHSESRPSSNPLGPQATSSYFTDFQNHNQPPTFDSQK